MATNITPIPINLPITVDRSPSAVFSPVSIPKPTAVKKEGGADRSEGLAKLVSIGTKQLSTVLDVAKLMQTEGAQIVANFEREVLKELKRGIGKIMSDNGRYYMSKETFEVLLQRARGENQNRAQIVIIPNIVQIKKAA